LLRWRVLRKRLLPRLLLLLLLLGSGRWTAARQRMYVHHSVNAMVCLRAPFNTVQKKVAHSDLDYLAVTMAVSPFFIYRFTQVRVGFLGELDTTYLPTTTGSLTPVSNTVSCAESKRRPGGSQHEGATLANVQSKLHSSCCQIDERLACQYARCSSASRSSAATIPFILMENL
jgi:hypothetical protein